MNRSSLEVFYIYHEVISSLDSHQIQLLVYLYSANHVEKECENINFHFHDYLPG